HPATNGQVERYVQTTKNSLKKLSEEGGDLSANLQRFLLRYRCSPHPTTGDSPAKLLIGFVPRTRLSMLRENTPVKPDQITATKFSLQRGITKKVLNGFSGQSQKSLVLEIFS